MSDELGDNLSWHVFDVFAAAFSVDGRDKMIDESVQKWNSLEKVARPDRRSLARTAFLLGRQAESS